MTLDYLTLEIYLNSRLCAAFEQGDFCLFTCVSKSDESDQVYNLSLTKVVQSHPWFEQLHTIPISKHTFYNPTELWDDIFEEIRLFLIFQS